MRSMWEEIENEIPELITEYFDADMDAEKTAEHGVEKIPTFVFLDKSGKEILRLNGVQNKDDLIQKVKENLDK